MKILDNHFLFNKSLAFLSLLLISFTAFSDSIYEDDSIFYEDILIENSINDPLEPLNRSIFHFNDVCYIYVLNPINNLYTKVTTERVRKSFVHFFDNLKFPVRLFGNIFQFKFKEASYEALKFSLNSTYGILGFNKPSDDIGFLRDLEEEGLSDILSAWGVPQGPYLVIPLLGPSTLRDFPGKLIEPILNPFEDMDNLYGDASEEWVISFYSMEFLAVSSEMLPKYKLLKKSSLDPYVTMRTSYYQFSEE